MNRSTRNALDAINRDFYAARAAEFSATREAPWPGWSRALAGLGDLRPGGRGPRLRILDVGCGSGRLLPWLRGTLPEPILYAGLDRSLPIVAIARRVRETVAGARDTAWILADLLETEGRLPCRDAAFDAVVAFGLLHHLPSFALRRALVADCLRLLPSGGIAALALWQFGSDSRFDRRTVGWEAAPGVATSDLEPGDRLLRWGDPVAGARRGERGDVRYCHYIDPDEAARLTAGLPADIVDTFRADGRDGMLNLYRILRRH